MGGFADKEKERAKRSAVRTALKGVTSDEPIKGQETIETLEGGKYMPDPPKAEGKEKQTVTEPKKKGRKALPQHKKKARYSFTIHPSVYEKAQEKAMNEGRTLSELVSEFLRGYAE